MRTHIVLDEQLVSEAMSLSQIKTKRELVEQALKEFISIRKRPNLPSNTIWCCCTMIVII